MRNVVTPIKERAHTEKENGELRKIFGPKTAETRKQHGAGRNFVTSFIICTACQMLFLG
jgi:hypothetical protein